MDTPDLDKGIQVNTVDTGSSGEPGVNGPFGTFGNFSVSHTGPAQRLILTPSPPSAFQSQGPAEYKSESWHLDLEAIKDSMQKSVLPNHLHLNDSKVGINAKDRDQAANLPRIGKHRETTFKLISEIQQNYVPSVRSRMF